MNNLADFTKYVKKEILFSGDLFNICFGDKELLIEIFDGDVIIKVSKQHVVFQDFPNLNGDYIVACLYAELLRRDLTASELEIISKICTLIEDNTKLFEPFIS